MKKENKVVRTDKLNFEDVMAGTKAVGDTSRYIENQEARGQRLLVASSQLPADGLLAPLHHLPLGKPPTGKKTELHEMLEAAGGKVVGPTKDDPIFADVKLPPGWMVKATDHAMHSNLLDEQGRVRAGIFYKAAFYDRSANIYPRCRLEAGAECVDRDERVRTYFACIKAGGGGGKILWRGPLVEEPSRAAYTEDECRKAASKLAGSVFPDYAKSGAYWDLTDEQLKAKLPPSESEEPKGVVYIYSAAAYKLQEREREFHSSDLASSFHYPHPDVQDHWRLGEKVYEHVMEWDQQDWKTKVHLSDDAALNWVRNHIELLFAQNYSRAVVTVSRGGIQVGQVSCIFHRQPWE